MLTTQDQKLIERSLEKQLKPIKMDIDAIQTRLASVEKSASIMDHFDVSNTVSDIEKRIAAVENKLLKMVTKEDLKIELKQNTKVIVDEIKKVLDTVGESMNRLDAHKREVNDALDDHEKRLDHLEKKAFV